MTCRPLVILCWVLAILLPAQAGRTDILDAAQALLSTAPDRSAGSPGAAETLHRLEVQLRALPPAANAQIHIQRYLHTLPRVERCIARSVDGELLPIAPLMPMGGQPPSVGTTEPREFPVVYGGGGTLEELNGKTVAGALVALEIDAPEAIGWRRCASLRFAGSRGNRLSGEQSHARAGVSEQVHHAPAGLAAVLLR